MPREPLPRSENPPSAHPGLGGAWPELRHYWLAFVLGIAGLAVTAVLGWQVDRWARARDAERFTAECRLNVAMIEQKMERYESALSRVRDVCGRDGGEISSENWGGWLTHALALPGNYPNLVCLLVAPKVSRDQRAAFEQRAAADVRTGTGTIISSRAAAEHWCPVWRRWAKVGIGDAPPLGDDLLAETPAHPSFEPALANTFGWVSERPSRLHQKDGTVVVGFWFVLSLHPMDFTNRITWQRPYETDDQAAQRRGRQRSQQATGLLAAFIGGELFLNQFNEDRGVVRVQLFTSNDSNAETLLNPNQPPATQARFTRDERMAWYGRRWTARFTSTPAFEVGSLHYRAALVWWLGIPLSLATAGALAWQTRGRWREAALAEQLREALGRQERLSRDLHDGTLQSVYGVGLGLQRAQRLLEKRPEAVARQLTDTTLGLQRVVGELRNFIRETDPVAREDVSLGEALQGVVNHFRSASEMELQLEVTPGADRGLTPAQSLQLLNIAREALSNSIRHSQARQVRITLQQLSGLIRLEVADDGRGFDPEAELHNGRGLRNLAARVRELGACHRWDATPGHGVRLTVEVPLSKSSSMPCHEN